MSRTRDLAEKVIPLALRILQENNNELPAKKVIEIISQKADLTDWDKTVYEKTGYIRWQSILMFHSISSVKAGFLVKKKGVWYLTSEGSDFISKNSDDEIMKYTDKAYNDWKNSQPQQDSKQDEDEKIEETTSSNEFVIERSEEQSLESFIKHIRKLGPYEFQDLCSALLRGMGYYTPFVAPKGKDGGVDIIAYKDPIGASSPRMKVQVKHRQDTKANSKEVRELSGILNNEEIGVFISSGGFSSDIERENRIQNTHIELIDLERFVSLWIEFYSKLEDSDKALMPIKPVYFVV